MIAWVTTQLHTLYPNTKITTINPNTLNLPFFQDDVIPAMVSSTPPHIYQNSAVTEWSKTVVSLDAVIIVTPQYNWGYPAAVKNVLDCLYHEWVNKPILIISYGGHGGGKAAAQLRQVIVCCIVAVVLCVVVLFCMLWCYSVCAQCGRFSAYLTHPRY